MLSKSFQGVAQQLRNSARIGGIWLRIGISQPNPTHQALESEFAKPLMFDEQAARNITQTAVLRRNS
jgi:hypothetical protein